MGAYEENPLSALLICQGERKDDRYGDLCLSCTRHSMRRKTDAEDWHFRVLTIQEAFGTGKVRNGTHVL